jgi:hypothetical protein
VGFICTDLKVTSATTEKQWVSGSGWPSTSSPPSSVTGPTTTVIYQGQGCYDDDGTWDPNATCPAGTHKIEVYTSTNSYTWPIATAQNKWWEYLEDPKQEGFTKKTYFITITTTMGTIKWTDHAYACLDPSSLKQFTEALRLVQQHLPRPKPHETRLTEDGEVIAR